MMYIGMDDAEHSVRPHKRPLGRLTMDEGKSPPFAITLPSARKERLQREGVSVSRYLLPSAAAFCLPGPQ